jgi:predicted transcriptional regulator
MKKHSGMRPHDIVILLKIVTYKDNDWYIKDAANELFISQSEVSESLNRSVMAGLISSNKKRVMKSALFDFLVYGLKYVYPVKPEAMVRGIKTSHSASPLSNEIVSDEVYVWAYVEGDSRGFSIEPLHPNVPKACLQDSKLYELLTLVDAVRIGNKREFNLAVNELKQRLGV